MIQSNIQTLASIVTSIASDQTDDQTRHKAELFIINSFSVDLIRTFIELIKSSEYQEQTKNSSIIIFCNILKKIKVIEKIPNISSILFDIYTLAIQLILSSGSISSSHFTANLLVACINSNLNINISFFQDIINGIFNSPSYFAFHGFCFAFCDLLNDYSIMESYNENQINDFLNGLVILLQKNYTLHENKRDSIDSNEQIMETCNEVLNLCKKIFEQDEICVFLKGNQHILNNLLQAISKYFNFHDTFSDSMDCFAAMAENDQTLLFPLLSPLIEVINNFISNTNFDYTNKYTYNSMFSICSFFDYFSNQFFFLYSDFNIFAIIQILCRAISIVTQNCDSNLDWEPHIIAQSALFKIINQISQIILYSENIPDFITLDNLKKTKSHFKTIISNLLNFATKLLSSPNYTDRYASLVVFQILINCFGDSMFFPVKQLVFQLVDDITPRLREASIKCLVEFVSSFPDHRCSNSNQFSTISEIFELTKNHLNENSTNNNCSQNDCLSISMTTFQLFYLLSLIPGFNSLNELMNLIFINLPFLLSHHRNSILKKILKIIKGSHIFVISSYPILEQNFISCLSNNYLAINDLVPSIIDIIIGFCERFGNKLPISPALVQILLNFIFSAKISQSSCSLPLIGLIFYKIIGNEQHFKEAIPSLCQFSISLLQMNSQLYSNEELITFFQCSIHSILFFKFMIRGNLIPVEVITAVFQNILPLSSGLIVSNPNNDNKNEEEDEEEEEIEEIKIPFNLQVYSINLFWIIGQKIPQFLTLNSGEMMKKFALMLNSYNFLKVSEYSRIKLFKIALETIEIIFSLFSTQFLTENFPNIIRNFIVLVINLKKQSSLNRQKIVQLFCFAAKNYPNIVRNAIQPLHDDFLVLLDYFSSDEIAVNKLSLATQLLGLKV